MASLGGMLFLFAMLIGPPAAIGADKSLAIDTDLLIVGGNESACAAAVQAARLGIRRIVLVNDIHWLGGQFSAEGVGPVDERTIVDGKSVNFPRSGLFSEIIERIRDHNHKTYGVAAPGNCWSATETIEPAAAARIFEEWILPYASEGSGQIRLMRGWQPAAVRLDGNRVGEVVFEPTEGGARSMSVRARLVIDSSDWGDVIRLSGARYNAGAEPRALTGEPSAPEFVDDKGLQEMNSITWAVTLRETTQNEIAPKPVNYDKRSFTNPGRVWVDSDMRDGIYSTAGLSIYTQRRLVDRRHFGFPTGMDTIQLNSTIQDYPLCQLPRSVVNALEATEPGASRKNIVDLTPRQRQIIFADAKQRSLAFLHYLQTEVDGAEGEFFRRLSLTDEFGTPDRLPPKPYVREGLRLEALMMLREQDIRAVGEEPRWAKLMPDDAVFGFQFHIDFHPTRREYLDGDREGPWTPVHSGGRNWHTHTDRAMFPLRGLIPIERDGLLGASKNIGVSSIVQAALRLHGQMMLCGQASATIAWLCLRDGIEPRVLAADLLRVREIQWTLVNGSGESGVLLWPYQDLPPDHADFAAANLMTVAGVWKPDPDSVLFDSQRVVAPDAWRAAVERCPVDKRSLLHHSMPRNRGEAVRLLMAQFPSHEALPIPPRR